MTPDQAFPKRSSLLVERGVERLIELRKNPKVRGLTVLVGGDNGHFFKLPQEYDGEMGRYAKLLADCGITVFLSRSS